MWYNWFWLEESVNRQNNFLRVIILSSSGTPTFSATWDLDSRRKRHRLASQGISTRAQRTLTRGARVRKYDICPNIFFVKDPFKQVPGMQMVCVTWDKYVMFFYCGASRTKSWCRTDLFHWNATLIVQELLNKAAQLILEKDINPTTDMIIICCKEESSGVDLSQIPRLLDRTLEKSVCFWTIGPKMRRQLSLFRCSISSLEQQVIFSLGKCLNHTSYLSQTPQTVSV